MVKGSNPSLNPALQSALGFIEPFYFLLSHSPILFCRGTFRCITTFSFAVCNLCCILTISLGLARQAYRQLCSALSLIGRDPL